MQSNAEISNVASFYKCSTLKKISEFYGLWRKTKVKKTTIILCRANKL